MKIESMLLTRQELARRWRVSQRTLDRRRQNGLLAWIDVAMGRGSRPVVRFRIGDVEAAEAGMQMGPGRGDQQ